MSANIAIEDRRGTQIAFATEPGVSLLCAGLAAGFGLPHECASGTCGSCKATIVAGEVGCLWAEAPGRRVCRAEGEILLCQSTALQGDVRLGIRTAFGAAPEPACRALRAVLGQRERLTQDVAVFRLRFDAPVPYEAGQFALITLPGLTGARAYSMTRHAPKSAEWSLLVRRLPGGGASEMLFGDTWNERTVEVFGPLGRAVFDPAEERSFLAVAGGSGIAGILAILDRAGQADGFLRRHPSRVFFGLREPDTAYGLDDLAYAVSGAEGGLAVTVAFSHAPPTAALASRYPELTFGSGFVHDVARDALASRPAPTDAMYFVAGPPAMVDATMRALVVELKVKPTEIRYDRFG